MPEGPRPADKGGRGAADILGAIVAGGAWRESEAAAAQALAFGAAEREQTGAAVPGGPRGHRGFVLPSPPCALV